MANAKDLTPEEKEILLATAVRQLDFLTQPKRWRPRWEQARHELIAECGPEYSPSQWFGGGEPLPEPVRARYLRAVYRLDARGLVMATIVGERLRHVILTPAGAAVAATLGDTPNLAALLFDDTTKGEGDEEAQKEA